MKNNAINSTNMKSGNKRLILNIIRKKPVSRAELSKITGLTRAAVTLLIYEMINDGVLIEIGTAEADYGRKPVILDINPHGCYAVGLSIARDGCHIGIMNIKGTILAKQEVILESSFHVEESLKKIVEDIKKIIIDSALPQDKFLGIGISAPGPLDINTGMLLNPPNFNAWHHVNIVQELKKNFTGSIFLENNATALALAEKNYGMGAGFGSFMLLVVDTGIGAGIIMNDDIYRGVGGFGSEVGHTTIDMNGIQCNCGNKGCLEVYASIPALIKSIHQCGNNISTWNEIVDRAMEDDELCRNAVDREALYLSAGIVNVMNILELEAVILTGFINYRPEMLLDKIRKNVESTLINRHINKSYIMNTSIMENSGIISAASVITEKFFKGDALNGSFNFT